MDSSDADLITLAKKELAIVGLAAEADVMDGCVVRQKKAYPVYDDSYKANVETIRAELATTYPSLHLVGRNGMHKYNNQDHAMMTAMLTVENIVAGKQVFDIWNVNEDAEYHEAGNSGSDQALKSVRMVPRKVAKPLERTRRLLNTGHANAIGTSRITSLTLAGRYSKILPLGPFSR